MTVSGMPKGLRDKAIPYIRGNCGRVAICPQAHHATTPKGSDSSVTRYSRVDTLFDSLVDNGRPLPQDDIARPLNRLFLGRVISGKTTMRAITTYGVIRAAFACIRGLHTIHKDIGLHHVARLRIARFDKGHGYDGLPVNKRRAAIDDRGYRLGHGEKLQRVDYDKVTLSR
jgi:hypothetical protein